MNDSRLDIASATLEIVEHEAPIIRSVVVPKEYSEINIFSLLMWKFNSPNGLLARTLGLGDPDAPFKWHFIFNLPELGTIEVIRSWLYLEVATKTAGIDNKTLIGILDYNLEKYKNEIVQVKDSLESYFLLINPFSRHRNMAGIANDELRKISIPKTHYPNKLACSKKEQKKHYNSYGKWVKAIDMEAFYSIILVSESAFTAESFINLIYAILIKEEIREDSRVFNSTLRNSWEMKVRRFSIDCRFFTKKADMGNVLFRDLKKLFELRNKIAHSFPSPNDLKVDEMWFYNNFPVLNFPLPFDQYQAGLNNRLPSRSQAIKCYNIMSEFIEYTLSLIDQKQVDEIMFIINSNPIGYNNNKNGYSIPFGREVIKAFFG